MKFATSRPFAAPDTAARNIIEIADEVEAVQDGRVYIERVNAHSSRPAAMVTASAPVSRTPSLGWLWRHESGTYLNFTNSGAEPFA